MKTNSILFLLLSVVVWDGSTLAGAAEVVVEVERLELVNAPVRDLKSASGKVVALDLKVRPGQKVSLSAKGSADPDGNALTYRWWQYQEADTYAGTIEIANARTQEASFVVPGDASEGKTIHVICEVTDTGTPRLTRYQRVVMTIER